MDGLFNKYSNNCYRSNPNSNEGYITYYDDEGNNLKQHYRIEEK